MARAATAIITLNAIKQNYLYAKSLSKPAKAIAIIKANAYGHGAIEVAKALADVADAFGVACLEEAKELRDIGIKQPILLLEGFFSTDELEYINENNLWCVIHSQFQLEALQRTKLTKPITAWLKMDTGMHRLGFLPEKYLDAWQQLSKMSQVENIVHMSHFSSADELNSPTTKQQQALFLEAISGLPGDISLANSSAILTKAVARQQWTRPGIMLYGASPIDNETFTQTLIPAMTFITKVISQRTITEGESVGYNALWKAKKTTQVGTVSIGYADGYPRHAANGTPVYINGKKSQILGRVSMDMMMVDLSMFDKQNCIGFDVELWGDNILANNVAKCSETIAYALFCGLTRRVNKRYFDKVL
ncbi:alanine racemase [Colwellia sp. MSW7]|jgi:alanine racemase|uniref:Alanine racemase n=1 Tax=Colwellia maritima TaxID=2912588 RepID=A0ABS9WYU2_9GAMM|nr:alanine racemase [Colwellia maritima]MCI2283160.1 alanine racemase [Colwellia maritima]